MGSSTGYIALPLSGVLMVFTRARTVAARSSFPLTIRLILVVGWAAQYVIDGGSGLGREL